MIKLERGEFYIIMGWGKRWLAISIHLHVGPYDKLFTLTLDPEWRNFNMDVF